MEYNMGFVLTGGVIRRYTPVECERLQGFLDNWTKYGEDARGVRVDMSDSHRRKMCGNAVTVNVVKAVFGKLMVLQNSEGRA
ncbi:DNA cytosine methyltransferase [Nocardia sp. NPDC055165]